MFGKLFGKDKKDNRTDTVNKVSKMNLTEMRSYVNNKQADLPVDADGLLAVMTKLSLPDEKTQKLYIEQNDMDTKKKKAFDIVILVAKQKKMSIGIVDMLQKFIENYQDIIQKYDTDLKEIYDSRLNDSVAFAINSLDTIDAIKAKMKVLKE